MPKRVLVVDDDAQILSVLEKRLRSKNYDVITAADGRDAVNKARAHMPDLIILDVMMPHMDGTEAARILRDDIKTRHIPIIYVTALKSDSDEMSDGMFDTNVVFGKPFNSEELLAKVEELVMKKK